MDSKVKFDDVVEYIAAFLHERWVDFTETLINDENISEERMENWMDCFVDYKELPEEIQNINREYAQSLLLRIIHTFPKLQESFLKEEDLKDAT